MPVMECSRELFTEGIGPLDRSLSRARKRLSFGCGRGRSIHDGFMCVTLRRQRKRNGRPDTNRRCMKVGKVMDALGIIGIRGQQHDIFLSLNFFFGFLRFKRISL